MKNMMNMLNTLKTFGMRFLFAFVLAMIFVAATNAQETKSDALESRDYELTGTWLVTIDSAFKGLHTYSEGGTMIETNQTDKQPPVQTTGQGAWVKLGRNTFGFTFVSFQYDANGTAVGALKVRSRLRLINRNEFTGQGEVLICDANVENCFSVANSTDRGVRLTVESPSPALIENEQTLTKKDN